MKWRDRFDETIREGIFALLILQVLSEGDKDRTQLHREIGVRTDGVFCKSDSLLLTLHELLLQKMISSCGAHNQIVYHIEEPGKEYLEYGGIHLKHITETLHPFFGWQAPSEEPHEKSLLSD